MPDKTTFPVSLEVAVHTDAFVTDYGLDFEGHLPHVLAEMAACDATIGAEIEPDHPLVVVGVDVVPDRKAPQNGIIGAFGGEFTSTTVNLTATVDHDRFVGVFGADPKDVLGYFLVARLLDTALLRNCRGTATVVTKGR